MVTSTSTVARIPSPSHASSTVAVVGRRRRRRRTTSCDDDALLCASLRDAVSFVNDDDDGDDGGGGDYDGGGAAPRASRRHARRRRRRGGDAHQDPDVRGCGHVGGVEVNATRDACVGVVVVVGIVASRRALRDADDDVGGGIVRDACFGGR